MVASEADRCHHREDTGTNPSPGSRQKSVQTFTPATWRALVLSFSCIHLHLYSRIRNQSGSVKITIKNCWRKSHWVWASSYSFYTCIGSVKTYIHFKKAKACTDHISLPRTSGIPGMWERLCDKARAGPDKQGRLVPHEYRRILLSWITECFIYYKAHMPVLPWRLPSFDHIPKLWWICPPEGEKHSEPHDTFKGYYLHSVLLFLSSPVSFLLEVSLVIIEWKDSDWLAQ